MSNYLNFEIVLKKIVFIFIALLFTLVIGYFAGAKIYRIFYGLNVTKEEGAYQLFIPTGSTYDSVLAIVKRDTVLKDVSGFDWLARKMEYDQSVQPGRYLLTKGMTNKDIVRKLRAGNQDPVKVFFNKYRTKSDLAAFASTKLELDSAELVEIMDDSAQLAQFGFTPHTVISVFLSDQYEFYWNTNAQKLFEKMLKEYEKYWNSSRLAQASNKNLTPIEVMTLASIVEEETNNNPEKPRVAGVYLNRIKKGMKLQADPTVKFALQDFTLRRITLRHTHFESPYNTYVTAGLPPGPICIPSKESIEAVLEAETHEYIFFCAKGDGSGTHLFARTYQEHINNANRYRRHLDNNGIF